MKRLLIISLLLPCFSFGQNLVPNPSFEDTVSCPIFTNEVYNAVNWSNCGTNNSADFYYNCPAATAIVGVPINWLGYQYAATGNGYCGFYCYQGNNGIYREYITAQLISTLSIGQKYYVKFMVNRCDDSAFFMASSNKVGARFSTDPCPNFPDSVIPDNFAHVYTDSIITDSINWTQVSGSFIADSAYQYIRLGNFFDDANTDIIGTFYSYYFIDDVCVSLDSLTCLGEVEGIEENTQDKLLLYPNPTDGKFTVANATGEIQVYDLFGRKVLATRETEIDMSGFSKGLYFVKAGEVVKKVILQ